MSKTDSSVSNNEKERLKEELEKYLNQSEEFKSYFESMKTISTWLEEMKK